MPFFARDRQTTHALRRSLKLEIETYFEAAPSASINAQRA
jgi:hypothetical protein